MSTDLAAYGVSPPPRNTALWRYMSLAKLLQLLQSRTLYFTRVDQLLQIDPYEGTIPAHVVRGMLPGRGVAEAEYEAKHSFAAGTLDAHRRIKAALIKLQPEQTYVSCWHASNTDSDAMWRLYGADGDGAVCVRTTASVMSKALPAWVRTGAVAYKSYDSDTFRTDNCLPRSFTSASVSATSARCVSWSIRPSTGLAALGSGTPWASRCRFSRET